MLCCYVGSTKAISETCTDEYRLQSKEFSSICRSGPLHNNPTALVIVPPRKYIFVSRLSAVTRMLDLKFYVLAHLPNFRFFQQYGPNYKNDVESFAKEKRENYDYNNSFLGNLRKMRVNQKTVNSSTCISLRSQLPRITLLQCFQYEGKKRRDC
ncbi:uncharacterized protein ACN2A1_012650 isoform 3-T5 [Glossina fuscipes fuscipes]